MQALPRAAFSLSIVALGYIEHEAVDVRKSTFGVGRGVWVAPWMGENGETILVAVHRNNRLIDQRVLKFGDDHVQASEDLWALLDRIDPMPVLRII